jgi:pimeloyl-ACP methyl ester carboxylesterase
MNLIAGPFALLCLSFFLGDAPTAQDAKYETSDGVKIVADYYAPKVEKGKKAPVAILIHMGPLTRKSWDKLVGPLHDVGFAVLAYDVRGRGESILPESLNLKALYGARSPLIFTESWRDAEGGKTWLASRAECDTSRVVVIGASEGANIAIDFARRDPAVKVVVGMSPYVERFGIKTKEHIKECTKKAVLLMAPDRDMGYVQELVEASGGTAKFERYIGGAPQHGSNLLDEPMYGHQVQQTIVEFCMKPVGLGSATSKP